MSNVLADYSLRVMQESDLNAIMSIESDVYEYPWTRGNFNDSLKAGHQTWVMLLDGDVIGYSVMMLVLDEAHLFNISIVATFQKQGLGEMLLRDMMSRAKKSGASHMFLEVRANNASAIGLYEKIGFVEVNVRRGYYQAKTGREDAVLMTLVI